MEIWKQRKTPDHHMLRNLEGVTRPSRPCTSVGGTVFLLWWHSRAGQRKYIHPYGAGRILTIQKAFNWYTRQLWKGGNKEGKVFRVDFRPDVVICKMRVVITCRHLQEIRCAGTASEEGRHPDQVIVFVRGCQRSSEKSQKSFLVDPDITCPQTTRGPHLACHQHISPLSHQVPIWGEGRKGRTLEDWELSLGPWYLMDNKPEGWWVDLRIAENDWWEGTC